MTLEVHSTEETPVYVCPLCLSPTAGLIHPPVPSVGFS